MKCENCGAEVRIRGECEPARCEVRVADAFGPATFLIIDGGWLVHRCTIVTMSHTDANSAQPAN